MGLAKFSILTMGDLSIIIRAMVTLLDYRMVTVITNMVRT